MLDLSQPFSVCPQTQLSHLSARQAKKEKISTVLSLCFRSLPLVLFALVETYGAFRGEGDHKNPPCNPLNVEIRHPGESWNT